MKGLFNYEGPVMEAVNSIGDCIFLSVMWFVFCLPILTIGASTTALYATACRVVRKKEGRLWPVFWDAFRENLRRSTLIGLPVLAVMAFLTVGVFVFRSIWLSGGAMGVLYWPALALWFLALTWAVYTAGCSVRFDGSAPEVLKRGIMMMALHPIRATGVLLLLLAGLVLALMIPFMTLIAPAALFTLCSFTTERVFRLHMPPEDLGRVESEE